MSDSHSSDVERWLPVVGYEGCYEVSNHGRVRSINRVVSGRRRPGRILKPALSTTGYPTVSLWKNNAGRTSAIHKLVLAAFVGQSDNGTIANHIDGNKKNNHISNLEITTYRGNLIHAYETGLNTNKRLSSSDIAAIRSGTRYRGYGAAMARKYGMCESRISKILSEP